VRLRGPVALFNLCSALPTALHLATGRLGADQLEKLDALLADPAFADRFKVVLLHHPPIAGAVSGRKSLDDQGPLRDVLARRGVDLVLHGHAHESLTATVPGPGGRSIPVLGVPSASAWIGGHSPARWHALEIEPRAGGYSLRVIARGLDPQTGGIRELGRYSLI